jgi:hypothetical protein
LSVSEEEEFPGIKMEENKESKRIDVFVPSTNSLI